MYPLMLSMSRRSWFVVTVVAISCWALSFVSLANAQKVSKRDSPPSVETPEKTKNKDSTAKSDKAAEREAIRSSQDNRDGGTRPDAKQRSPQERNSPDRAASNTMFEERAVIVPNSADTLLGGSVPEIWKIERITPTMEDERMPDLLDRDTNVPAVSGKVVRYAIALIQRYDTDANGTLHREEWMKMQGNPQAIDLDGDTIITLNELVRFFAYYGRNRTIHYPNPPRPYLQTQADDNQHRYFKPITISTQPKLEEMPAGEDTAASKPENQNRVHDINREMTEELLAENDEPIDDQVYEEIIAGRQTPLLRKYYTASKSLRGVPVWFLIRDLNGDGQVSIREFSPKLEAATLAIFGRQDKDGDGFITPDEVRKPRAEEKPLSPE